MKLLFTLCLIFVPLLGVVSAQTRSDKLSRSEIKAAEQLLSELGYWTGPIDGRFDAATQAGVIAFQKWEGRSITGTLTSQELQALRNSSSPTPRDEGYSHFEVDVDRQVLLLVDDKGRVIVLPVSTGSDREFIDEGQTSIAYTPRGRFIVYDKISGWEHGPIGRMYFPNYISGGVAIHGSRSVPNRPETHGCIRVPLFAAREVSRRMPEGTIVLVYDKVSFVSARAWAENPKLKLSASIE